MALNKSQPISIQFAGGVETKQDPKQVPPAKLLDLQNATFIKQTTLAKRNGYSALGSQIEGSLAQIINPTGLAARNSELVEFANGHGYSYLGTGRWSDAGPVDSVVASDVPLARTGTQQSMPDVASNGGITVAAWEDSADGGLWLSIVDTASQRVIVAPFSVDVAGQQPRCIPCGGNVHVYYARAATNQLMVVVVNPALPQAVPAPKILTEDLSAASVYDADATTFDADGPSVLAWAIAGGGYRVAYVHPSGVLGSPLTALPVIVTYGDDVSGPIGVAWDQLGAAHVAVAWAGQSGSSGPIGLVGRLHLAADFSQVSTGLLAVAPATVERCTVAFAYDIANGKPLTTWWAFEQLGATADTNTVTHGSADATTAPSAPLVVRGVGLLSTAFCDGVDAYAAVAHPVAFFAYVAIVKLSAGLAAPLTFASARSLPGTSPGLPTRTHVSRVANVSVRQHAMPLLNRLQLESANGDKFSETGIRYVAFDFANAAAWQTAQLGRGLYLGSACMQHYDGKRWAEADFHCAPDTALGTIAFTTAAGGGLQQPGSYLYKFLYEEIDAQGELHRGAVSVGALVATDAGDTQATFAIPTYRLTAKTRVRIGVFRSLLNETGDDSTIAYYRVSSLDPAAVGANGYVLNDPTVDTVSFTDSMDDATAADQEPLYTDGGILSNDPPAFGGGVLAGGMTRLFWSDSSDPNLVRFSQQIVDDVAVEMAQPLNLRVDPFGGAIVGIGIMDATVIVLKQTALYIFGGPGPDANPSNGTDAWTPPQLLTSDVGCISPRSIVQTPIGIAFQSQKGIRLLGRDQQVVDIGASVYAYNDQSIVRATLLPDRNQIVFLTDAGRTLLYDYEHKQWSTYLNHEGLDAVVVNGVYQYLRTDGRVFVETPGVYADDNGHIPMRIETAWIKFAGTILQAWQRVLTAVFLGAYKSPHTLSLRFRIDYEESWSPAILIPVDGVYSVSNYGSGPYGAGDYGGTPQNFGAVYQQTVDLNQRCQAIAFRIEDVEATTDFGAAFELSELLLVGGVLGPQFPAGASRQS